MKQNGKQRKGFETGTFRHAVLTMSVPMLGEYGPATSFDEGAVLLRFREDGWRAVSKTTEGRKLRVTVVSGVCMSSDRRRDLEECVGRARELAALYGWTVESEGSGDGCGDGNTFGGGRFGNVPLRWAGPGYLTTLAVVPTETKDRPFAFLAGSPVMTADGHNAFRLGFILPDGGYEMKTDMFFGSRKEASDEVLRLIQEVVNG